MTMQITERMIEVARSKAEEIVPEHFTHRGEPGSFHYDVEDLAARVLVAALAVAPDPATDSDPRSCATCNGTGSLWNGGVESGRCPTCDGKGHDPAPGDAEFEACGLCGDPPPPNGKRVASKPLPPTPGPFNPFGKQDLEGIVPSPILTDAFGEPTSIEEVAPNTFKYTWTDDDVESP